jgi:hypothetical protein
MEYSIENQQRRFDTGEKMEMTVKDAYDSLQSSVLIHNSNFYFEDDTKMYFGLEKIEKSNLMPTNGSAMRNQQKYKFIFNNKYNDDGPGHVYVYGDKQVVFFPTTKVNRIDDDEDEQ